MCKKLKRLTAAAHVVSAAKPSRTLINACKFKLINPGSNSPVITSESIFERALSEEESAASTAFSLEDESEGHLQEDQLQGSNSQQQGRRGSLIEIYSTVRAEAAIVDQHDAKAQEVLNEISKMLSIGNGIFISAKETLSRLKSFRENTIMYTSQLGIDLESICDDGDDNGDNSEGDDGDEQDESDSNLSKRFVKVIMDSLNRRKREREMEGLGTRARFHPLREKALFLSETTIHQAIELGNVITEETSSQLESIRENQDELFDLIVSMFTPTEEENERDQTHSSRSNDIKAVSFFKLAEGLWNSLSTLAHLVMKHLLFGVQCYLSYVVLSGWNREQKKTGVPSSELPGWKEALSIFENMELIDYDITLSHPEDFVDSNIQRSLDVLNTLAPKSFVSAAYLDAEGMETEVRELVEAMENEIKLMMTRHTVLSQSLEDVREKREEAQRLLSMYDKEKSESIIAQLRTDAYELFSDEITRNSLPIDSSMEVQVQSVDGANHEGSASLAEMAGEDDQCSDSDNKQDEEKNTLEKEDSDNADEDRSQATQSTQHNILSSEMRRTSQASSTSTTSGAWSSLSTLPMENVDLTRQSYEFLVESTSGDTHDSSLALANNSLAEDSNSNSDKSNAMDGDENQNSGTSHTEEESQQFNVTVLSPTGETAESVVDPNYFASSDNHNLDTPTGQGDSTDTLSSHFASFKRRHNRPASIGEFPKDNILDHHLFQVMNAAFASHNQSPKEDAVANGSDNQALSNVPPQHDQVSTKSTSFVENDDETIHHPNDFVRDAQETNLTSQTSKVNDLDLSPQTPVGLNTPSARSFEHSSHATQTTASKEMHERYLPNVPEAGLDRFHEAGAPFYTHRSANELVEIDMPRHYHDNEVVDASRQARLEAFATVNAASERLEIAEVEFKALSAAKSELQQEVLEYSSEAEFLRQEKQRLQMETQQLAARAAELLQDMHAVLAERDEALHSRDGILHEKSSLENEVEMLASNLTQKHNKIEKLESKLQEMQISVSETTKIRNALIESSDELRATIADAKLESQKLQQDISKSRAEHLQLQSQLQTLQSEIALFEQQRDMTRKRKEEEFRRELEAECANAKAEARAAGHALAKSETQTIFSQLSEDRRLLDKEKGRLERLRASVESDKASAEAAQSEVELRLKKANEAKFEAESVLSQAKIEAKRVIERAELEAANLRQQGEAAKQRASRSMEEAHETRNRLTIEKDEMLESARKEAEKILKSANEDANSLLQNTRTRIDQMLAEAKHDAEKERAKGRAAGERERSKVIEEAENERQELLTIAQAQARELLDDAEYKNKDACRIRAEAQQVSMAAQNESERVRQALKAEEQEQIDRLESLAASYNLRGERALEIAKERADELERAVAVKIAESERVAAEAADKAKREVEYELGQMRKAWFEEERVLRASIEDLRKASELELSSAQERAEAIVKAAQAEAKRIHEEAERVRSIELAEERLQVDRELRELRISLSRLRFEEETANARAQRAQAELDSIEADLNNQRAAVEASSNAAAENARTVAALEARAEFLRKAVIEKEKLRDDAVRLYEQYQQEAEAAKSEKEAALSELRELKARATVAEEESRKAHKRLNEAHEETKRAADLSRQVIEEARRAAAEESAESARAVRQSIDKLKKEQYELVQSVAVQRSFAQELTQRNEEMVRTIEEQEARLKRINDGVRTKAAHLSLSPIPRQVGKDFNTNLGGFYATAPESTHSKSFAALSTSGGIPPTSSSNWLFASRKIGHPPPIPEYRPTQALGEEAAAEASFSEAPHSRNEYNKPQGYDGKVLDLSQSTNSTFVPHKEQPSQAVRPALDSLNALYERVQHQSKLLSMIEERDRGAYASLSPKKLKEATPTHRSPSFLPISNQLLGSKSILHDHQQSDAELAHALAASRNVSEMRRDALTTSGAVFGLDASRVNSKM